MTIDPGRLTGHIFPEIRQRYNERDAILYALGLGLGSDPLDAADLDFLLETRLKVLPTMAVTLATPGMWIRDPAFGVDFVRLVHSEQDAVFHMPLPPAAEVVATPRVASLHDRGAGKGAVLVVEREIRDAQAATLYTTIRQTLLLRGDGGFGGEAPPLIAAPPIPDRAPDHRLSIPISPRAALIYRLSGDWNPLHAVPAIAQAAGFDRPILHGLASYGIAGRAVMRATGAGLRRLSCRFSGIVMPGDTIDLSIWRTGVALDSPLPLRGGDGGGASPPTLRSRGRPTPTPPLKGRGSGSAQPQLGIIFEAHVGDRKVLDRGLATLESA